MSRRSRQQKAWDLRRLQGRRSGDGLAGGSPVATGDAGRKLSGVPHTYDYPRPAVTVDTVLATIDGKGDLQVLLIQRAREPFAGRWALPGGFVDQHEDLEAAARREMREETHVELGQMVQLGAYGTPHRDPRAHTVGVAFLAICGPDEIQGEAGDDAADCRWFSARKLPKLAFDHAVILKDARAEFARLAASRDDFRRVFCGRRKPQWLEKVRRAAKGKA